MMRSLVSKKIISFFTDLNKNTKSFVLVTTDSLFLFFSWILFLMSLIIMTEFKYSFTYYLIQSYTWGFIIPLFLYLVSMYVLRGFREVIRNFNLDNIYHIFSLCLFLYSQCMQLMVLIKKPLNLILFFFNHFRLVQ